MENHLSVKTNELFKIASYSTLYDLTNTTLRAERDSGRMARFGRSKEKRNDESVVVLSVVTNMYGFVKY
ncbi:MAG: hypothetical protein IPI42_10725 [Saprospiraceae bacterium]|nr:hypothetical protein [Candidatus Parvibacillus calidus]